MRILKGTVLALLLLVAFSFKAEKEVELVKIKTSFGDVLIYLYDQTPQHKANFLKLAQTGYLNGTTFHRIIPNFMIQGGDPDSKDSTKEHLGGGGPGYTVPAEFNDKIIHKYGTLAGARDNNPKKESSGSQFYIVTGKKWTDDELNSMEQRIGRKYTEEQRKTYKMLGGDPFLDGNYTVFGEVVTGMDVVEKIGNQPVRDKQENRPVHNIAMTAEIVKITSAELTKKYHFTPQVAMSEK